jgi:phage terminase small subunit
MEKPTKLKPKQIKFLEEYAKDGDKIRAYLAAGYKAKTEESARVSATRLLQKIDENIDYREVLHTVGLNDRRVAEALKEMVEHKDARVRVQALNIVTKILGWQKDEPEVPKGVTIMIVQNVLPEEQDVTPAKAAIEMSKRMSIRD